MENQFQEKYENNLDFIAKELVEISKSYYNTQRKLPIITSKPDKWYLKFIRSAKRLFSSVGRAIV